MHYIGVQYIPYSKHSDFFTTKLKGEEKQEGEKVRGVEKEMKAKRM